MCAAGLSAAFAFWGTDAMGLPTEQEIRYFELFRNRINMEDELTNHRMSWLIYTQALLVALWASVHDKVASWVSLSACVLGAVCCVLFFLGVWAAQHVIRKLKVQYDKYPQNEMLPDLVGGPTAHQLGKAAPYFVPSLFMLLWAALFLWSACPH
jgi:hypothetical protein